MSKKILNLDGAGAWQFKGINAYGTMPAGMRKSTRWMKASVPGTVHTDLLARGILADPFVGMNENPAQWVDTQQWVYRRRFKISPKMLREPRIELLAEGLDTFAEIRINRKAVALTANMFIAHRISIKRYLRKGLNTIEILFDSPTVRSKALEERHGRLRVALEPHRVYTRKAQYSFGWDWGPKFTTSGIWKNIRIESCSGPRLNHPFARVRSVRPEMAIVELSVEIEHATRGTLNLRSSVEKGAWGATNIVRVTGSTASILVHIPNPGLWWPNGYGDQVLYHAHISLLDDETEIDSIELPFAIRTVRLMQENDDEGTTFILEVNGVKIFCKGADWIPSDTFIPRIPDSTYERLLGLAKESHMNMIRVWGGGFYEQDVFYNLCDRLGLMVWQDFMFACGEYPQDRWFLDEVKSEASSVVRRLRNHPSIVVWCGNNECEWIFCTENAGKSPDDMSGARIFSGILPAICKVLDGTRPYWRSSPFGTNFPNGESDGNHHQWTVWSFWKDYKEYENDKGRFITEFGFQAPANRRTFEDVLPEKDCTPQSPSFEHHNKQVEGPERLIRFQAAHHRISTDFDGFIYKCQLVQAEALKCAVEHWRRRKFLTAGTLFWQLNDCWPVSSWAVIDSALRPKAAYYFAKQFYAPLLVSFKTTAGGIEVHFTNDRLKPVSGTWKIELRSFNGKRRWSRERSAKVAGNSSSRLLSVGSAEYTGFDSATHYLHAQFLIEGAVVAMNRFFFEEPKRLRLPVADVSAVLRKGKEGACRLSIKADRFVKYLRLELEDVLFDDNYFDLDAGEWREIMFNSTLGVNDIKKKLRLRWLE